MTTRYPFAALLLLFACNPDAAVESADQAAGATEDEEPPPDLPCGDVNLWTDDLNCGACGNECEIMWPGTHYEAGHCVEGECGPVWSELVKHSVNGPDFTCAQACSFQSNSTCVPLGCSGMTAFLCLEGSGEPGDVCDLSHPHNYAHMDLTMSCFETMPNPNTFDPNDIQPGVEMYVSCCCERP